MNGFNDISICVFVFFSVFAPYVFMTFVLRAPAPSSGEIQSRRLPFLFALFWRFVMPFSETIGDWLYSHQPNRALKIQNTILVSGIKMHPNHYFALEFVLAFCFSLIFTMVALLFSRNAGVLIGVFFVSAFIGFVMPGIELSKAAELRQGAIVKSLPFAIDLIGSAMRSGVDFMAAVRYYVTTSEKSNPLAIEFGVMLRELELGRSRVEALEDLSQRIRHDGFTAFKDAVVHGLEIGASIVGTLKVQAEELRRQRFCAAEQKAARAVSSMIFPIALFIMPAMFLIIGTPILMRVFATGLGGLFK